MIGVIVTQVLLVGVQTVGATHDQHRYVRTVTLGKDWEGRIWRDLSAAGYRVDIYDSQGKLRKTTDAWRAPDRAVSQAETWVRYGLT